MIVITGFKFYLLDQLKYELHKSDRDNNIVIWGTGVYAKEVYDTLSAYGITVNYFGDNNRFMQGQYKYNCKVLSSSEVAELDSPYVIIGSYVYRSIALQLFALGITHVCGLIDTLKYGIFDLQHDEQHLKQYVRDYKVNMGNKILLEIYGNIGDAILRLGIVKAFLDEFGTNRIYILVESDMIAEVFRLLTENVIILNKRECSQDSKCRLDRLTRLNSLYFESTVILCDIRLHATRRILNSRNFNVYNVKYHNQLPDDEYLLQLDIQMVKENFVSMTDKNMSPVGILNHVIKNMDVNLSLPKRYAAVNMGASINERHYDARSFAEIMKYLISKGYEIVLLGHGDYDDNYAAQLLQDLKQDGKFYNLVSQLSLLESFYAVFQSKFFVGTDSGMWNASYILDKDSVVLYGGGEYGCFKHDSESIHYVITDDTACFGCKWYCTNKNKDGYSKCVGDISSKMIIDKINEIIHTD